MNQPAEIVSPNAAQNSSLYEHPLNERMRTFLRIEFLYKQLIYNHEQTTSWASRSCVNALLDIVAILLRGDIRGEVLKELERQQFLLERLQSQDNVDSGKLQDVIQKLQTLRGELNDVGPKYLQPLRDNEFLNAIRHRSAIPGGTCAFDLPDYTHWLRQSYERRSDDLAKWLQSVKPLCDSVAELLWLQRNSRPADSQTAHNGVYQHTLEKGNSVSLVVIEFDKSLGLFPEVSGSHHRFTIRFMGWQPGDEKPTQCHDDLSFKLTIC